MSGNASRSTIEPFAYSTSLGIIEMPSNTFSATMYGDIRSSITIVNKLFWSK